MKKALYFEPEFFFSHWPNEVLHSIQNGNDVIKSRIFVCSTTVTVTFSTLEVCSHHIVLHFVEIKCLQSTTEFFRNVNITCHLNGNPMNQKKKYFVEHAFKFTWLLSVSDFDDSLDRFPGFFFFNLDLNEFTHQIARFIQKSLCVSHSFI